MLRGILKWTLIIVLLFALVFLLGPKPDFPRYTLDPIYLKMQLHDIDRYIADKEAGVKDLKPDNEARIVWHNDTIKRTPYALVYLHGFSASQEEGDPVHEEFAKRYGMNLYLSRLEDHGRADSASFRDLTPKALITSAKEAIAIGALIGEKVIVMSCSTGSTYSIMLAPDDSRIAALIMYSPNICIKDPAAALVTYPWGRHLMEVVMDGELNKVSYSETARQYWNEAYHINGIVAMQSIIDDGMKEDYFAELDIPVYVGCYYKDEENQDQIVSVAKMDWFYEHIGTSPSQKRLVKFPEAGRHVFTSHVMKEEFGAVSGSTYEFAEEVLGLQPLSD